MKLITSKTEYGDIITNSKIPVIIDFYSDFCNPCKLLIPILEKIEATYINKILFIKVNIDNIDCEEIIKLYNINFLPTLVFIKDKIEIKDLRIEGLNQKRLISNIIKLIK